jgi:hypothetical protein
VSAAHHLSLSRWGIVSGTDEEAGCAYWARPDVQLPEDVPGKAARVGRIFHELAHGYVLFGGEHDRTEWDPTEAAEALTLIRGPVRAFLDEWRELPGDKHVELRLRLDARTMRTSEAPRRGEPGYTRPGPTEVTGELDLVRIHDGIAWVEDLKTGSKRHVSNAQLAAYGVLASRHFDVERVQHRFVYALKTKVNLTEWIAMGADDLDAEAGHMAKVLRTLPMAQPVPGSNCEYRCPLKRGNCPAFVSQVA